jgi:hypothetical protein
MRHNVAKYMRSSVRGMGLLAMGILWCAGAVLSTHQAVYAIDGSASYASSTGDCT